MTDDRKQGMEATRVRLQSELESVLDRLNLDPDFADCIFALPRKKFSDISIRGFFAHMVFEYVREQAKMERVPINFSKRDHLFDTQLPFIFEMVMTIQYLTNQILDGKGGVLKNKRRNLKKINENLIAGNYLKDVLYEYISKCVFPENLSNRAVVLECLRKMFQYVDAGQFAEKKYSSLKIFQYGFNALPSLSEEISIFVDQDIIDNLWQLLNTEGLDKSKESFTRFYLNRMYCTSASPFIHITELILNLTNFCGVERKKLLKFATEFGMLTQMLNDIADLIPAKFRQGSIAKIPEDAFSDLRNINVTLPTIFFLSEYQDFSLQFLRSDLYNSQKQQDLFNLFKPICKTKLIPLLRVYAIDFRDRNLNMRNKFYSMLGDTISVAWSPRYFKYFGRIKRANSIRI